VEGNVVQNKIEDWRLEIGDCPVSNWQLTIDY